MFSTLLRRSAFSVATISLACSLPSSMAYAQSAPNAGTLLHQYQQAVPAPTSPVPEAAPVLLVPPSDDQGRRVHVKAFVIDAHQFSEDDLRKVVADDIGKDLTLGELQQDARKISAYYLDHGYLARAYLPPQKIQYGFVKIIVLEGVLGQVKVDTLSQSRFDNEMAQAIVANHVQAGQILRPDDLQQGLAILNEEPGVVASASLQPGASEGQTDALIHMADGPLLTGSLHVDNEGIRSVGSTRGIATGSVNDALGLGDQLTAMILKSSGSDYSRLGVTLPAGVSGLRYGVNASMMHYGVDPDFSTADQQGYAYTMGGTVSYPVMRGTQTNITTDMAFNHERLVNSAEDLNVSDKQLNVGVLHANAVVTDDLWAGAVNTFDASTTFGSLDLSGDEGSYAQDQATARTNGFYNHVNLSANRLQSFDDINQLFVSASAQFAPQNLDSSEQMSLGGPDGVRAYPTDEALGDMGMLSRVELRHNVYEGVQLFDFYDAGWIQQHQQTWTGWSSGQPNSYWLQDIGVGANWKPVSEGLLGVTLAHTLGSNPGQINGYNSDGYNNHWRLLVQGSYAF